MKLKNLKTNYLGRNLDYYSQIDSTQKEVWRRVHKNQIDDGMLIIADIQTSGIGTHGRIWHTDEKSNIAFSFYIKLDCNIENLDGLTLRIAEIIVNIFKSKYNINFNIKEPNDLMYNGKKVGGILTETRVVSSRVKDLVVGIGINTNKQYFTDDIKDIATSIKKEFNISINTEDFISQFCNEFEVEIQKRRGNI